MAESSASCSVDPPLELLVQRLDRQSGRCSPPAEINMRKLDGWQTLAAAPIDQPIDLAL
jgi:hypothetical protein